MNTKDKTFKKWQLDLDQKKTNRNGEITPEQYRKIIETYLQVYFNQFYSKFKAPMYFPFTGMIKLTQSLRKGRKLIYWLWYKKPGKRIGKLVEAKKITRGGGFLRNLELKYMKTFDHTELPEYYKEINEIIKKKEKFEKQDE